MDIPFIWGMEQIAAIKTLKYAFTTTPILIQLDYSEGAKLIIFAINRCKNKWGCSFI